MEGTPNITVVVAQVGYVLFAIGAFLRLPSRNAVLVSIVAGFLLVPVFDRTDYIPPLLRTKGMFVPGVVLAISLVKDWRRWLRFRPRPMDLPIALVVLGPLASSLHNDLGLYDGLHSAFTAAMAWGAPYLLGRMYLGDPRGFDDLADTIVVAAMGYALLGLWEVRMSPHLHHTVYGFRPHAGFGQTVRYGGYRPTVFLDHGLMVGLFLAGAALIATWLWWTGARKRFLGIPAGWVAAGLCVITVLAKSTGAILLLAAGLGALAVVRRYRSGVLVLALALVPPVYAAARISGWSPQDAVDVARRAFGADRAQSLEFRIQNEDRLRDKALEQAALGWGGWGRGRVYDEEGHDVSVTDGLWIISLSRGGLLLLAATMALILVPALGWWRRFRAPAWADPRIAAMAAVAIWTVLWAVDSLANAMLSPIFPLAAGALTSVVLRARDARPAGRRQGARRRVPPRNFAASPAPVRARRSYRSNAPTS